MQTINLRGPDGNVFALMGISRSWGKQLGWTNEQCDNLVEKMMAGTYEDALDAMLEVFPFLEFVGRDDPEYEDEDE